MISSNDFQKVVELIDKSKNVLLTTHTRPDGDACGSVAALSDVLTALGKKVKPILLSPLPEWYEFLFAEKLPILGEDVSFEQLKQGQFCSMDLIIILDTNSYSQLPRIDQYLKRAGTPIVVIDHHVTADGVGDVELVDTTAAATSLIVFDLLRYANWPVTEKIAKALFVALATDTGWFQFNNTDSRVHRICGDLVDAGANPAEIYHDLYQNFSPQRFKLMTAMLNSLELHLAGRYATQQLHQRDFQQTGAAYTDTENLINECQRIRTVEAAALFVELKDGRVRCSLRSGGAVDVRGIAQKFGGGGHTMAAGTYLPGPVKNAKQLIFEQIAEQFAEIDRKNL